MFNPQMTSSQMELLPLVCLCLLSWSGTTSADQHVVVEEGSDAILPCSFGVTIEQEKLEWKKDGQRVFVYDSGIRHDNLKLLDDRFSHFPLELKHGNASLKIRNTKVADSGDYTCDTPHLQSSQTVHVKLVVGAAPEPSVTTLHQTDNWALLQCKAHGVPDLEVTWQDSDGNILPAEERQVLGSDRVYIILNTTVTKTGRFRCVATQKNISHMISAQIYVHFNRLSAAHIAIAVVVTFFIILIGGVLLAVVYKHCIKQNRNKGSHQHTEVL